MLDRRVRTVFSCDGLCGCQTEESEVFLAMMDRVDARQKSQKCCFSNEVLCGW